MARDDDDRGAGEPKLIPEWNVAADDQVVLAGLAVVAALALLLGWNAWRGDDDSGDLTPAVVVEEVAAAVSDPDNAAGDGRTSPVAPAGPTADDDGDDGDDTASEETGAGEDAASSTTTEASTTTTEAAAPAVGDVQAAIDPFFGDITGQANGTVAVLTGFVANEAESLEAEGAAAEVDGITSVDNQLEILEPPVLEAVQDAGVTGAGVAGEGTVMTVRGTINSQTERGPALTAAAAVDGVTDVIDELQLSVAADLNELPQVQFATASAEILSASFSDLDAAAELLNAAGDIAVEIQGYTDTRGDEAANQRLSQERADAVRTYLIGKDVDPEIVTATGFGETNQFGPEFVDNRLVLFQQVDR